eukprot:1159675-Pelagomonas_calceolata.AAC.1
MRAPSMPSSTKGTPVWASAGCEGHAFGALSVTLMLVKHLEPNEGLFLVKHLGHLCISILPFTHAASHTHVLCNREPNSATYPLIPIPLTTNYLATRPLNKTLCPPSAFTTLQAH